MGSKRQKNQTQQTQLLLAFAQEVGSESPHASDEGTVLPAANLSAESPTGSSKSESDN